MSKLDKKEICWLYGKTHYHYHIYAVVNTKKAIDENQSCITYYDSEVPISMNNIPNINNFDGMKVLEVREVLCPIDKIKRND